MLLSYLYDTMEAKEGDAGMRLLFAEDERDLNDIVCQKLRKEGYTVVSGCCRLRCCNS